MPSANENIFLRAFRLHRSGIRFLRAGLHSDAIHSLIHGLEVLQFSMQEDCHDSVDVKFARWKQNINAVERSRLQTLQIDKKPLDHSCYTNEEWMTTTLRPCCHRCRGSLVAAMLYNMALGYHLHALTFEEGNQLFSFLNQTSTLYSAAEGILRKYDLPIPESLENNERHIHWIICSGPVADSALLSFRLPNAGATFDSIILPNNNEVDSNLCHVQANAVEADFGSALHSNDRPGNCEQR